MTETKQSKQELKHAKTKQTKRKKNKGVLGRSIIMIMLFTLAIAGFYITTFDVNDYRKELTKVLSDSLGRVVSFKGKLSFALSYNDGLMLEANDVSIGNPSWASRPDMVRVGTFRFRLALPPLLERKINITALLIDDAQIQLELSSAGKNNWSFSKVEKPSKKLRNNNSASSKKMSQKVTLHIKEARVTNSQLGFRNTNGKYTLVSVAHFTLIQKEKNSHIRLVTELDGINTNLEIVGLPFEQLGKMSWPFSMTGAVGKHTLNAAGVIGPKNNWINFKSISLSKNKHLLTGAMNMSFQEAKPRIMGLFKAKELDSSFFTFATSAIPTKETEETKYDERFFSRNILNFSSVKKANMKLRFKIDRWHIGLSHIDDINLKIRLENGKLSAPFFTRLGGSDASGTLKLDISNSVPVISFDIKSKQIQLAKLFDYNAVDTVISGQADMDIKLHAYGHSSYELASNANGRVNFLMDSDKSSTGTFASLVGKALNFFVPSVSSFLETGLNCVAAHYIIKNGLLETKGFLADTRMTSIIGKGQINLPDEYLNLRFLTKPKGMGSIIPPVRISGPFSSPKYTVEGKSVLTKMFGIFTGDNSPVSGVPDVLPVGGQNACEIALSSPIPLTTTTARKRMIPSVSPEVESKIKNIGGQLFDKLGNTGLFGY